jgi:hypothetical protein
MHLRNALADGLEPEGGSRAAAAKKEALEV